MYLIGDLLKKLTSNLKSFETCVYFVNDLILILKEKNLKPYLKIYFSLHTPTAWNPPYNLVFRRLLETLIITSTISIQFARNPNDRSDKKNPKT